MTRHFETATGDEIKSVVIGRRYRYVPNAAHLNLRPMQIVTVISDGPGFASVDFADGERLPVEEDGDVSGTGQLFEL